MRWKLLLIASLLATIVGAGASFAIAFGFFGSPKPLAVPNALAISTLLIPVAAITSASIFVYRHTARRRKLQAMATALLALVLTLAAYFASVIFFAESAPKPNPNMVPAPQNIGSA